MRKTSRVVAEAFKAGNGKVMGNTSTNGQAVHLFGNRIAWIDDTSKKLAVTLAGWNTPTTRERVNSILQVFGKAECFVCRKGLPFFQYSDGSLKQISDCSVMYI